MIESRRPRLLKSHDPMARRSDRLISMEVTLSPDLAHPENGISSGSRASLHVFLTLTPFFPSASDEVRGCYIAESNRAIEKLGVRSSVIAVSPIYYSRVESNPSAPARWVRYPQIPGNFGLSSAGRWLYARLLAEVPRLAQGESD